MKVGVDKLGGGEGESWMGSVSEDTDEDSMRGGYDSIEFIRTIFCIINRHGSW